MPMTGQGWEIHVERTHTQRRQSDGKVRTVGRYQVFHDGVAQIALAGTTAESAGPGSNAVAGNGKRVEPARYPLFTHDGVKYQTHNYTNNTNQSALPRPGILLGETENRVAILIHPGIGFLASIGCINLCRILPDAAEPISFPGSRARVIAVIDDMKTFLGNRFPDRNGKRIPAAFAVIDGEPF
jgi:hypothetical protein